MKAGRSGAVLLGGLVGGALAASLAALAVLLGLFVLDRLHPAPANAGQRAYLHNLGPSISLLLMALVLTPVVVVLGVLLGAVRAASRSRPPDAAPDNWAVPDSSSVAEVLNPPTEGSKPGPA